MTHVCCKEINGVRIFPFASQAELLDYADTHKGILVAINAEKILHATDRTRSIINRNIGYCDGAGAVMALKKHGCPNPVKIAGCELWLSIIAAFRRKYSFYFVGGTEEVIEATIGKLQGEFPELRIAGYRNGYLRTDEERRALLSEIGRLKPDVVFVAMGSPKQELLMEEMYSIHPAIYQGLGGSFDVYTGNVKRAPKWWIEHNLEFAYRLLRQPSRIGRQIHLLKFYLFVKLGKI